MLRYHCCLHKFRKQYPERNGREQNRPGSTLRPGWNRRVASRSALESRETQPGSGRLRTTSPGPGSATGCLDLQETQPERPRQCALRPTAAETSPAFAALPVCGWSRRHQQPGRAPAATKRDHPENEWMQSVQRRSTDPLRFGQRFGDLSSTLCSYP